MALTQCKECDHEVSSEAESCPKCGVSRPAAKPISLFEYRAWILIVGSLTVTLVLGLSSSGSQPPAPPETPEQVAAREKADEGVQRATAGARWLKKTMRDPASFKLETAFVRSGGNRLICYEYRAKNGFGGTNIKNAILAADLTWVQQASDTDTWNRFAKLWNKECINQNGTDVARLIQPFL